MEKNLLYIFTIILCIIASKGYAQRVTENTLTASTKDSEYIDLGLTSGTKWKNANEHQDKNGFLDYYFDYDGAMVQFGKNMPTKEQWMELINECSWQWNGLGYNVTGPNGESIILPAAGLCLPSSYNPENVSKYGYYWSSMSDGSCCAWRLIHKKSKVYMSRGNRISKLSVRLVR